MACASGAACWRQQRADVDKHCLPAQQVDELLEQRGVRLCGEGAADALTIRHPGLTLFPLDDEAVDAAGPQLQVMAALLPNEEDEESGSESSDDERAADGEA